MSRTNDGKAGNAEERVDRLSAERRALYEKLRNEAEKDVDAEAPKGEESPNSHGFAAEPDEPPGSDEPPGNETFWQQWAQSSASSFGSGEPAGQPWQEVWKQWQNLLRGPTPPPDPFAFWRNPGNPQAGGSPWEAWGGKPFTPPTGSRQTPDPSQAWSAAADSGDADGSIPLVALKKSGTYPPLFLVAPIFGSVFPYHHLVLHLEPEQPVYGLQSPTLHGRAVPETIPEVAEIYIRLMKQVQPVGPYYVGGYSYGGWAAFEIARRLLQMGEEVAFLGMLGTPAPPAMAAPLHAKAMEQAMDLVRSQIRLQRDTGLDDAQREAWSQAEAHVSGNASQRAAAAGTWAALFYVPRPIELGLYLFLTADMTSNSDHTLGWWTLCTREIDVSIYEGNHLESFSEPNVQDLAKKLCAALRKAREAAT